MEQLLDIRTLSFMAAVTAFSTFLTMLHVFLTGACLYLYLYLYLLKGFKHFLEEKEQRIDSLLLYFSVAGLLFYTYFEPSVMIRIIIVSLVLSYASGRCAWVAWKDHLYIALCFLVLVVWFLFRAVYTFANESTVSDFMSSPTVQALSFLVFCVENIVITMGLISINYNRTEKMLVSALENVETLQGLLSICSNCRKVRDDSGYWSQLETYIEKHSQAEFTHSLCPTCLKDLYPEIEEKLSARRENKVVSKK